MKKDNITHWDGVRNFQAQKFMKQMKLGDQAFFYHSNQERAIKGIVEIVKEHYPDHTDASGRFIMVDVKYINPLENDVPLSVIKSEPELQNMLLIRQSRLSVMPISDHECHKIMTLSKNI